MILLTTTSLNTVPCLQHCRGVYETALEMLDTFVPYVQEHLAQHPNGKIAFAGHSLGGSLATLLMVIMVHRYVQADRSCHMC